MFRLVCFLFAFLLAVPSAQAGLPSTDSIEAMGDYAVGKKREEQEAEISEAEKERLQKLKDRSSRIIVLKWNDTTTDYQDATLIRNVKSRIDRPDALFFPSVDLYQNGRKHPDDTLIPADQPALVPDVNLEAILRESTDVSQKPWDSMSPGEWGVIAEKLRRMLDLVWFIEKVEQREPLFHLYTMIGYAAENQNSPSPPYYESLGGQSVNYYYYLAATMAWQDPSLMSKLTDMEIRGQVQYYLQGLQDGRYPFYSVDFELENEFDVDDFTGEYEVYMNGLLLEDIDPEGQFKVPLGIFDVYLKRTDTGHGLSDRLEFDKLEEKAYFVRDVARKEMGTEFIEQLMLHPNECTPEVAEYVLHYMAIYAKLHSKAEIYIAVPKNGDPNKVWIWRYDRQTATLQLVGGGQEEFPVRFALIASSGVMYNGAAFSVDSTVDNTDINALDDPAGNAVDRGSLDLQSAHLPVNLTLRGHYNRLMVGVGMEFGYNLAGDGLWVERYRTPEHKFDYGELIVTEAGPAEDNEDGTSRNGPEVYHYKAWSRYTHFDLGVVFGRDAARAFGPRLALSTGWTDLPHAWVLLGHFGWSLEVPLDALHVGRRIRPLVDVDARGGMAYTLGDSIQTDLAHADPDQLRIKPVFGLTAGIGTTF
jgi:hypothetical protein